MCILREVAMIKFHKTTIKVNGAGDRAMQKTTGDYWDGTSKEFKIGKVSPQTCKTQDSIILETESQKYVDEMIHFMICNISSIYCTL